jgi:hypothetical protein
MYCEGLGGQKRSCICDAAQTNKRAVIVESRGTNLEGAKDRSCRINGVITAVLSLIHISTPISFAQSSRSCMSYGVPSSFISSSTFGMTSSCNALRSDRTVASFSLYLDTRALWAASSASGTDIIRVGAEGGREWPGESHTPETSRTKKGGKHRSVLTGFHCASDNGNVHFPRDPTLDT